MVAALSSYLDARNKGGRWSVRIDDVDQPRTAPGATDLILRELERLGLEWDGTVNYQSGRMSRYRETVESLVKTGNAFACGCSRRDVGKGPYRGTCRSGVTTGRRAHSVRVRVDLKRPINFTDRFQGACTVDLEATTGDFLILRADNTPAYHLATVLDDYDAGITHIIRGADLLKPTAPQVYLGKLLGFPRLHYGHVPLAQDKSGLKLSKSSGAPPTSDHPAHVILRTALTYLGQSVEPIQHEDCVARILQFAINAWSAGTVPSVEKSVARIE